MANGYIEYSDGTGATPTAGSWVGYLLTTSSAAGQLPIPTSGVLWTSLNIYIERASTAVGITAVEIMMTWDSLGKFPIHGPSQSTYNLSFAGDDSGTYFKSLGIDLGIAPTFPSADSTNGQIYVWLKGTNTNANDKVKRIRLHFNRITKG